MTDGITEIKPGVDQWEDIPDKPMKGIWKPKLNEVIEGEVLRIEDGRYGAEYVLRGGEGEIKLPAHKQLISKLEDVKVGQMIRVTQAGEKVSGKGKPTQMYRVAINHGYVLQVPLISPPGAGEGYVLSSILEKLRFGAKFFEGGLIPQSAVIDAAGSPANFQALKDKGLISCTVNEGMNYFRLV
jgi:hypothetical protein